MIGASVEAFPNNVVSLVNMRANMLDDDLQVFNRPLRASDPNQCVGIFASQWSPDETSIEMRGAVTPGPVEPTIQRYTLSIQCLVKDTEEERGLFVHAILSKMVRSMLYHDAPLRVALASLSVTLDGSTEATGRWGLGRTRYLSNEIRGSWIYLSTLEFWIETETM